MNAVATLPALSRLSFIIAALCKVVAARTTLPKNDRRSETVLAVPLVLAVMRRLRRAEAVILSLAARFHAGRLKPPARRAPLAKPQARPTRPALVLPRHFAWLCPLVPCDAVAYGNHLRLLLEEPEMQALIAASPHAVRILRPTCRMLAIDPSVLTPAPPAPAPSPSKPTRSPSAAIFSRAPRWRVPRPSDPPFPRPLVPD